MLDSAKIELRNLSVDDYKELKISMIESYGSMPNVYWSEDDIRILVRKFPEGQFCIVIDQKIAGCALSMIVDYRKFEDNHTYSEVIANDFAAHTKNGDVLYGIDVFIHPEELTPKQYIEKVKLKEIHDPVLSFQLSNDFHVKKVIKGYLRGDYASKEFAVLLEWHNIYYTRPAKLINTEKTIVRLGLVQWQMRLFKNYDALVEQIEFFVDAVSDYKSDFILFPELFNAPLMAEYNHLNEAEAMRSLASYTERLLKTFSSFAITYNINIITGSMPQIVGEHMYNVGYLCRRDGSYERYEKLHITPAEGSAWGMKGGSELRVMDTDCGKVGVLICYDVEFPEISRILADQGMKILFVPFMTDTQNGYSRVRLCAQARAIENECYVAIAGSVGNLPKVNNMDIQYAQSGVFTPSDFAFPVNGIKAEATPNSESTLLVDVDLDLLKELHNFGSVRNLKDRRKDLYSLKLKEK